MLLNLTNHPSANWDPGQLNAAKERWNTILDMPFPNVPPDFDEDQIIQSAEAIVKKAVQLHPDAVLCQGEMTMVFLSICFIYTGFLLMLQQHTASQKNL